MTKILLVDDDPDLLDLLSYALRRQGYEVLIAADGPQGLAQWREHQPDLALLDVRLPTGDGFDVCRRIKEEEASTPVILLTGRDREADVLHGFLCGADDYVTKPFRARELVARMEAVLRRTRPDPTAPPAREIRVGDLVLDLDAHQVTRAGRPLALTKSEFRILLLLAIHVGKVVPYAQLVGQAWGCVDEVNSKLLRTHISHIRRKLGLPAEALGGIQAITGVGYWLAQPGAPQAAARK